MSFIDCSSTIKLEVSYYLPHRNITVNLDNVASLKKSATEYKDWRDESIMRFSGSIIFNVINDPGVIWVYDSKEEYEFDLNKIMSYKGRTYL